MGRVDRVNQLRILHPSLMIIVIGAEDHWWYQCVMGASSNIPALNAFS